MTERLQKIGTGFVVDVAGWELARVCVDYQVRLYLANFENGEHQPRYEVVVETPFVVRLEGTREYRLEPAVRPEALSPIFELLHLAVESMYFDSPGTLRLGFRDGGEIEVPADAEYEAWQINGPDFLAVCVPGGGEPVIWRGGKRRIEGDSGETRA